MFQNYFSDFWFYKHVYHPINSYHLVKRISKFLPKLLPNNKFIQSAFEKNIADEMIKLANGLYNIEEYYHTTPENLGKLSNDFWLQTLQNRKF